MPRNGRVQVQDLAPPERIQPAPVQSDTFAQAAPPPIDNNLSKLAEALGGFSTALNAYHRAGAAERDRAERTQRLGEWNTWLSSTEPGEQLAAIRAGRAPYYADPYIGAAVRTYHGQREAQALAAEIDADIQAGNVPMGSLNFNPQRYLLERAAPYVERMRGNPEVITAFRAGLDQARNALGTRHAEAVARAGQQHIENVAAGQLGMAFDNAFQQGLTADQTTAALRAIYRDLGPRQVGGSLDLQYGRMDELLLSVLKERARDPRTAVLAVQMLSAQREAMDGSTTRLGALSDVHRHAEAVRSIREIATKTLADDAERRAKAGVTQLDTRALLANDGSFAAQTSQDFRAENPYDTTRQISVGSGQRQEQAVNAAIAHIRAGNGGQMNFEEEFRVTVLNGVRHPQWHATLESTFAGLANTNAGDPQQVQRIREAATLYNTIADRNYAFLQDNRTGLSRDAREFFDTYTALVRYAGRTPEQAAVAAARVFSTPEGRVDPSVASQEREAINTAIKGLDFSWLPFHGGVVNGGEIQTRLVRLATAYVRADGVMPADAVRMARDRIQASGVYVNGRAVFGTVLGSDDGQHVSPLLTSVFNRTPEAFRETGITSGGDLSIAPFRDGLFLVVKASDGMPVLLPQQRDTAGAGFDLQPAYVRWSDVNTIRTAAQTRARAEALRRIEERRLDPFANPDTSLTLPVP